MGSALWASLRWALTMAPGSPSVNNNIASNYLSTTAMAAPGLSLLAMIIAILLGHLYFSWELRNVRRDDEHFCPRAPKSPKWTFSARRAPQITLRK